MLKKHKAEAGGGVNLGLIIVPMLDMSFQILSFFIMTYHPSALEGHIAGSLAPPADFAKKAPENKVEQVVEQSVPEEMILPELQEALTVMVSSNAGLPGKVSLQRKSEPTPRQIADATDTTAGGWKGAKQTLAADLKQVSREAGTEKANIKIAADADLQQQYVLEVYDVCKQSGFSKIHFVPPAMTRPEK
jgi:biopolymer transport protein ExbD